MMAICPLRYLRRRWRVLKCALIMATLCTIIRILTSIHNLPVNDWYPQHQRTVSHVLSTRHRDLQHTVDYIAEHLDVKYKIYANGEKRFKFGITFSNKGPEAIQKENWKIYFYHFYRIIGVPPASYKGLLIQYRKFKIGHINGNLYQLSPERNFTVLSSGGEVQIILEGAGASVAKTDVFPNWYVSARGMEAKILKATEGESLSFVQPFTTPESWKRDVQDTFDPFTPTSRYIHNLGTDLGSAPLPVIPTPLNISIHRNIFVKIDEAWTIAVTGICSEEGQYLSDKLNLKIATETAKPYKQIVLSIGNVAINSGDELIAHSHEAYRIVVKVDKATVKITGRSRQGVFYGIQTLLSLKSDDGRLPKFSVTDAPRFPFRGYMLDVARNFFPKQDVFDLIEAMAMYKMNKLHLHLTDDEGWRLEIRGLSELVKIGSRRGHTETERDCLLSQLGSGPYTDSLGSGYYTKEDYRDILRHAARHHVDVIPEIDFPGHARAAVVSMLQRNKDFEAKSDTESGNAFILTDLMDNSTFLSIQHFSDNVVNPCIDSTYRFINSVINKVKELHEKIQPLKVLHIGGDELPKGALLKSPSCMAIHRTDVKLLNYQRLSIVKQFEKSIVKEAFLQGLDIQAWDEVFYPEAGNLVLPKNFKVNGKTSGTMYANPRHSTGGRGRTHRPIELANAGYKVIHSGATHLFLDHAQEPDPNARGQYWATRYLDTKRVFSFAPLHYFYDIDTDVYGQRLPDDQICGNAGPCPELKQPQNIVGMEAHVWTEMIRTRSQLHEMTFPRLLAVAERSWHRSSWESLEDKGKRQAGMSAEWALFVNTLGYKELKRLEEMDIEYYLPFPGIVEEEGLVKMNAYIPGMAIEYSVDGGVTWTKANEYEQKPNQKTKLIVRTSSYKKQRKGKHFEYELKSMV